MSDSPNNGSGNGGNVNNKTHSAQPQLGLIQQEQQGLVHEVGSHAVWTLSSCKHGCGVDQLRDNNLDTYWQSDGGQPHLVNILFSRKTTIQAVCIYLDFKLDESYTPRQISLRAGNHFQDLEEIEKIELEQPSGWITIDAKVRAFHIQLAVLSNHQGGRDTHLRQVKVYSPVSETMPNFSTISLAQHLTLR
ncbi:Anaphase-promoting complex subunit 10, partial [Fragariocoptes setiger]